MGFISPKKNNHNLFTVYTKSKCIFCVKTKYLMKERGYNPEYVDCDEYLQDEETKENELDALSDEEIDVLIAEILSSDSDEDEDGEG
jgi:glutaredoxin